MNQSHVIVGKLVAKSESMFDNTEQLQLDALVARVDMGQLLDALGDSVLKAVGVYDLPGSVQRTSDQQAWGLFVGKLRSPIPQVPR